MKDSKIQWTGKTYGGYFGNWCFLKLLKFGMYPAYLLLVFVASYFQIFRPTACKGGVIFLEKVLGQKVGRFSFTLYKLLFSFGVCLLDRTAYLIGSDKIKIIDDAEASIKEILSSGKGVIVLTAHIGGWAISATQLEKYGRKLFIAGVDTEDSRLRELAKSVQKRGKSAINTDGAMGNIQAYSILRAGGIVAMHADRYAGGRFVDVEFFGKNVKAPLSPYALAKASGVPIVQTICVREKLFTYRMKALSIIDAEKKSPEECAEIFMKNMESALRVYPYQWFNFYDFWA